MQKPNPLKWRHSQAEIILLCARWHHLLVFPAPAVLIYSVFMALPLLDSLRLSFFHQNTDGSLVFYGLRNFNNLVADPYYGASRKRYG